MMSVAGHNPTNIPQSCRLKPANIIKAAGMESIPIQKQISDNGFIIFTSCFIDITEQTTDFFILCYIDKNCVSGFYGLSKPKNHLIIVIELIRIELIWTFCVIESIENLLLCVKHKMPPY